LDKDNKHKIIIFDGVCNLCNDSVKLVIKHDTKGVCMKLATEYGIDTSKTDSILLVDHDKIYTKSTAALKIAKHLSGGYPLIYGFMIVPNFIRNWVYDFIAKNRYKWFGRKDSCMIPTAELKKKFL
jgi:predicted DCC family thiol-disulfide oxidoreductase YuxK